MTSAPGRRTHGAPAGPVPYASKKDFCVLGIWVSLTLRRRILERADAKEITPTRSVPRPEPGASQHALARRIGGGGTVVLRGRALPVDDPVFVARSAASPAASMRVPRVVLVFVQASCRSPRSAAP